MISRERKVAKYRSVGRACVPQTFHSYTYRRLTHEIEVIVLAVFGRCERVHVLSRTRGSEAGLVAAPSGLPAAASQPPGRRVDRAATMEGRGRPVPPGAGRQSSRPQPSRRDGSTSAASSPVRARNVPSRRPPSCVQPPRRRSPSGAATEAASGIGWGAAETIGWWSASRADPVCSGSAPARDARRLAVGAARREESDSGILSHSQSDEERRPFGRADAPRPRRSV